MKCHYEILGIDQDANDSEIKASYRKLALKWHPDKNLDNPEDAKKQFQLVQQAYEILSDPHERAWYDNHREQILRGKNSDYEEICLDVFQYFTISCFNGYNDEPDGFYSVYSNVFEKISLEDAEFIDKDEFENIPKFGNSKSEYEEIVGPFYAYWQSYCTKKTYTWLCPYNINEIKDRRVLREIDKEMKKIVQKARRERNEEVRNLVSFVRKRDKRVQAYRKYLEEKAALNRLKQENKRLEQIKKRKQQIEESKRPQSISVGEEYEEQLKLLEQEYGVSNDESEDYSSDDNKSESKDEELNTLTDDLSLCNENSLFCIACNKTFKNVKSFENHETSKKHRDNLKKIKKEILEEEITYSIEISIDKKENEIENESLDFQNEISEIKTDSKIKNKKNKRTKTKNFHDNSNDVDELTASINLLLDTIKTDDDDESWENKKSNKKSKSRKGTQQNKKEDVTVNNVAEKVTSSKNEKQQKESKSQIQNNGIIDVNHICVTCKSSFESKNKLFQHLKKTNHGVYIPKINSSNNENLNKKGNKLKH